MTWQAKAACANSDPQIFFPVIGQSANLAKAICRRCPVITECGEFAINTGEQHGVWGGMSVDELEDARRDPVTGIPRHRCACDDWAVGRSPRCAPCREKHRAAVVRRYDQKRRASLTAR